MNLLVNAIITDNQKVNEDLDEHYSIFGPEPREEAKSYQTEDGYKAVVQDRSSFDMIAVFENGKLKELKEVAF